MLVVLRNVESNGLVGLADAHCNHLICNVIEQIGHCKCEDKDNANGNHVVENELSVSNAIGRKAFGLILIDEYARKDCADNTAHTVSREHIQGIVDAGVVFPVARKVRDYGGDNGDDNAVAHRHPSRRRCNGHQTKHTAHSGTHCRRLAACQTIDKNPHHHCRGGCSVGVQEGFDGHSVSVKRAARVESEPAQPQQHSAQNNIRHVGWLRFLIATAPQKDCANQSGNTARSVNHNATRKILDVHSAEKAVGVPGHMRKRAIDEKAEQRHKNHIGRKTHTFGKRTRYQ